MGALTITKSTTPTWDSQTNYNAVLDQVILFLNAAFAPPNNVNITISYDATFAQGGAQSTWNYWDSLSYSNVRSALQAISNKSSIQTLAYNNTNLPASNPF